MRNPKGADHVSHQDQPSRQISTDDQRERFLRAYLESSVANYFAATEVWLDLTSTGDRDDPHLSTIFEAAEMRNTLSRVDLIEGLIFFGKPFDYKDKDDEETYRFESKLDDAGDWELKMSCV
jgi:hypothetical protein